MKKLELEVTPRGKIRTVYDDSRVDMMKGFGTMSVHRASHVEWEHIYMSGQTYEGWTVRAAHKPTLVFLGRSPADGSIIVVKNGVGLPAFFKTREEALKEEVEHFWELLPQENET